MDVLDKAMREVRRHLTHLGNAKQDRTIAFVAARSASTRIDSARVQLGRVLREIKKGNLWMGRKGPEGERRYSSFENFVRAEVALSYAMVQKLVRLVEQYSDDEIAKYGVSKLLIVLRQPNESRKEMLEAIVRGATSNTLEVMGGCLPKNKGDASVITATFRMPGCPAGGDFVYQIPIEQVGKTRVGVLEVNGATLELRVREKMIVVVVKRACAKRGPKVGWKEARKAS